MTREGISTLLMVTAIILPLASWKNFRRPGVPFWRFAPLHSVHKFLYPVGTALYWMGLVLAIIGLAVRWLPI
ncbi:hypothetical protein Q9Q94_00955 [Uliginosibacterium sp. 31-16]|uniref:hypothetical protein n=1 Tax=Uliginosibacterium sp. 31-16 TaxID=3068315 RepID=UPI00273D8960|nr:hypothetical protein [Uliginosibacterium sp. 31-16]MDP5238077.1 hypothetical protein [Uliginosibacterium sp. 31-16]